jgi:glycogen synthase
MACQYYGSLPVVHDTGGLHDTVEHLSEDGKSGNGFVFRDYDHGGLLWGIDEAMRFYRQDETHKEEVIARVMNEACDRFSLSVTARKYIDIYESMLARPLVQN